MYNLIISRLSFSLLDTVGFWPGFGGRGLFLLMFHALYFVSSVVEINFSLGQKQTVLYVLLAGTIVFLLVLPLKGINWQPHATHPLFIGVTEFRLYVVLYFSLYHSRSGHIGFLPRVVFSPTHPPCFCLS